MDNVKAYLVYADLVASIFKENHFITIKKNFCSRLRQHLEDRIVNLQITGDLNLIIGWEKGIIKFEN